LVTKSGLAFYFVCLLRGGGKNPVFFCGGGVGGGGGHETFKIEFLTVVLM